MKFLEFQKVGIKFLVARKTALLADDMGLGKTVQVAGALSLLRPKRAIILTLASLKINWLRELTRWIPKKYKYHVVYKIKEIIPQDAEIIILNYDLLIHKEIFDQLKNRDYDVLVLDEAHNLSNMKAKRTGRVFNNRGLVRIAKRIYALTGTPVRNRPKDFYVMLRVLAPEVIAPYLDYESFVMRYCGGYRDSYGVLQDNGASNIEELNERLKTFMLRRRKEEVLKELPKVIEKIVELERTDEIEAVLREEENLLENMNEFNPNSELGVQATIRRQLGEAKLKQILEYLDNLLKTEDKVVVFAYHKNVINAIRSHLRDCTVRCVQGGMSAKMKQFEVDLFVNDPNSRLFVGQITAAGFGIDGLQKVANHVVFAELDWVPGNLEQARDRVVRIGQTKSVMVHYLVVPDSLESVMLASVIKKGKVIAKLLEQKSNIGEIEMTLESTLERIANALEARNEILRAMQGVAVEAKENDEKVKAITKEEPKETPEKDTKKSSKKSTKKAESVEAEIADEDDDTDIDLDLDDEDEEEALTLDDVRATINDFIGTFGDQKDGKKAVIEVLNNYGYSKIPEIKEKDFAAIVKELKRGSK